ncbi:MAG: response regulator [Chloroflexi bacterium]|nr:response regulator [Chloroflexota bacterium]
MKKILLADDDATMLALLRATLDGDDRYQVFLARDGDEALAVAYREKPDLVFLDVMMPAMNGFEVCMALKSNADTKDTTVVMLTALAQDHDMAWAAANGADGYITKPFSPLALLAKVEDALGFA